MTPYRNPDRCHRTLRGTLCGFCKVLLFEALAPAVGAASGNLGAAGHLCGANCPGNLSRFESTLRSRCCEAQHLSPRVRDLKQHELSESPNEKGPNSHTMLEAEGRGCETKIGTNCELPYPSFSTGLYVLYPKYRTMVCVLLKEKSAMAGRGKF